MLIPIIASGGGGLVTKSCRTLTAPWTIAYQAPLSMGFSRQEYWNGLPFPSPGDLPDPGIEPRSCIAGRWFTTWAMREATMLQRFPLISPPFWKFFLIVHLTLYCALGCFRYVPLEFLITTSSQWLFTSLITSLNYNSSYSFTIIQQTFVPTACNLWGIRGAFVLKL